MTDYPTVECEECIGCGWMFSDGGERHKIRVYNQIEARDEYQWICTPCYHASHSFANGKMLPKDMAFTAQCTNLILAGQRAIIEAINAKE